MADHGDGTVTETAAGDTWTLTASGGGWTVKDNATGKYLSIVNNLLAMSATQTVWTFTLVGSAPPPPPPGNGVPTAITLSSASPTITYNAAAGTVLATASVTMSDGSQFAGTLTSRDTTGFFAISGLNIVTGRALTSADVGTHTTTITATQNGHAIAAEFSI